MAILQLQLLGPFRFQHDHSRARGFASDKERALLAYLALAGRDVPIQRQRLTEMFWNGFTEASARHSLRNALYNLRRVLAPLDLLHTTRQTVQFAGPSADFWCDVWQLDLTASDPLANAQQIQDALALVQGELLHGLELPDAPMFAAWLAERRQHLAAQVKLLEQRREQLRSAPPGYLPRALTPFFGRERELSLLAAKLVNSAYGLLTLTGEGGIGKTRLALALAEQVRPAFPGGVWFIPLASLSPDDGALAATTSPASLSERLASAIAARLSLQLGPGALPAEQIAQRLPSQRLLLLLDNFEHLHGAEPLLVDLLQAAPNLCLLVTSRRRLNLQAEYAFRLTGLPTPPQTAPGQADISLSALRGFSSVHLFVERADRRCGGFELDEDNQEAVAQICRLVEGMPLAIDLAAGLSDRCTCAEIASAIAANVDALASSMADVAVQHRSLRAVFETSWQLLSKPEQAVLARCAIFRGGFTAEAAAAVADASPALLASLADQSLLRQVDETRYDMHELLRQLAAEKLLEDQDTHKATAAQHCAHYAGFLQVRANDLPENAELMQAAWQETYNLKTAWLTAVRQRDAAILRQMARGMVHLWYSRGLFQQGVVQLAEAAAVLRADLVCATEKQQVQAALSCVLLEQAFFSVRQGQITEAIAQAQEAVGLSQAIQDTYLQADASLRLAMTLWAGGQMEAAEAATRCGLEKAEQAGDASLIAIGLAGLSIFLGRRGQIDAALGLEERAVQVAEAAGRLRSMGSVLSNLGVTYSRSGDFQKAADRLGRALALRRQAKDRLGTGVALMHLGQISLILGDFTAAQQHLDEALTLFETMESTTYRAETLAYRALAYAGRQDYRAAHQDARQADDLAAEAGNDSARALAHLASGMIWWTQEEYQPALETYEAALALAVKQGDNEALLAAQAGKARVLAAQGEWPAAQAAVQQMLPLPERIVFSPLLGAVDACLVASQVLATIDPAQAQAILQRVQQRLLAAAATIDDAATRHAFLHDNPSHRQVLAQAGTYDEAMTAMRDAIRLVVESRLAVGDPVPTQ